MEVHSGTLMAYLPIQSLADFGRGAVLELLGEVRGERYVLDACVESGNLRDNGVRSIEDRSLVCFLDCLLGDRDDHRVLGPAGLDAVPVRGLDRAVLLQDERGRVPVALQPAISDGDAVRQERPRRGQLLLVVHLHSGRRCRVGRLSGRIPRTPP